MREQNLWFLSFWGTLLTRVHSFLLLIHLSFPLTLELLFVCWCNFMAIPGTRSYGGWTCGWPHRALGGPRPGAGERAGASLDARGTSNLADEAQGETKAWGAGSLFWFSIRVYGVVFFQLLVDTQVLKSFFYQYSGKSAVLFAALRFA